MSGVWAILMERDRDGYTTIVNVPQADALTAIKAAKIARAEMPESFRVVRCDFIRPDGQDPDTANSGTPEK